MHQMKRLSIVWGALMILIFAAFTTYGLLWKKKTEPYRDLENTLVKAAEQYGEDTSIFNNKLSDTKVTYQTLVDNEYLTDELKVDNDKCSGYVKVSFKNGKTNYKGYIKCSKYKTADY